MSKAVFIGLNVAFIVAYSLIAQALDGSASVIEIPQLITPPEGGGFLDKIIAPFVWAFNAAGKFFQLITYPFSDVGQGIIPTLIFGPLVFIDVFIIYGMIRGGGT